MFQIHKDEAPDFLQASFSKFSPKVTFCEEVTDSEVPLIVTVGPFTEKEGLIISDEVAPQACGLAAVRDL